MRNVGCHKKNFTKKGESRTWRKGNPTLSFDAIRIEKSEI